MRIMRNSNGDTIVEVLIALAVLTAVIVGAYASANRSQNASQASQERAEAIKVAETQIERIKGLLANSTLTVPAGAFCINEATNAPENINNPADPFAQSLDGATLPYERTIGVVGACGNISERFNVAVKGDAATGDYEFLVRWHRIGGGRDQINMYYRVH